MYKPEVLTESRKFESSIGMDSLDTKNYRKIYNNEILHCLQQDISLYSSTIDELSHTDEKLGGHFIHYLLNVGISNELKNLDAIDSFQITKEEMKKDRKNQIPRSSFPKSARNFLPFSLGRYA